jgi:replicative DNA helicase
MTSEEKDLISQLINYPRDFALLGGRFQAEFMSDEKGRIILQAMSELGDYDLLSLREKLNGKLEFQELLNLGKDVLFMPNMMIKCYAQKVFDDYRNRKKEEIIKADGINTASLTKITELDNFELFEQKEDVAGEYLEKVEKKFTHQTDNTMIPTGFNGLDRMIDGFGKSELIFLAGNTGSGKTTLALNFAYKAAKSKKKVLFFSLEMKQGEILERLVKNVAEVENYATMTQENFDKVVKITHAIGERLPLEVNDKNITLEAMYSIVKDKQDIDMVIIDHLNILTVAEKFKDKLERLEYTTRKLKEMAKELNIPIVVCCQLNRSNSDREVKYPTLSDLRGSGSIEQDANLVLFVYRPEYYLAQTKPDEGSPKYAKWEEEYHKQKGKAKVVVAKNRRGKTGEVEMLFKGEIYRFEEL